MKRLKKSIFKCNYNAGLRVNLFVSGGTVRFFFLMPHGRRTKNANYTYFKGS